MKATSTPGMKARVCAQMSWPPCACSTEPRYRMISGTSSMIRQARMHAASLAAG